MKHYNLIRSLKALFLAVLMTAAMCVSAMAGNADDFTVKRNMTYTVTADSNRKNYVIVRNLGANFITAYDNKGNSKKIAPNYKYTFTLSKNETRTIYLSPQGSTRVRIAGDYR